MADRAHELLERSTALFSSSERFNSDNLWDELSEFMLNNQSGMFKQSTASQTDISSLHNSTPGIKRTRRVYDSTAMQAVHDLAAAFQGTLTNPATVWSKLRFRKESLNDNETTVQWLEEVNSLIHNKFNESNFNTEIAKGYQSFVSLGNMALFLEENDSLNGFRFTAVHIAQVAWTEDKNSIVDTFFRKFSMSAKQAHEKWGNILHRNILRAVEKEPDKEFEFLHAVLPRDPALIKLNDLGLAPGESRPVASVYVDMTHSLLVEELGYYEMPVFVARWSLMPNEKYGRGPGHLALPDTRTLNKLKQRGLEAIDLQVRPPIFANQRDVFGQLDLRPGGISIVGNHQGIREFVSQARTDVLQFSTEDLKLSIRNIFFLDKLLLPPRNETGEMTAFEVSQRVEQMQRVLGPVLSRLNHELLNPLIERSFQILLRSGQLPELPAELVAEGVDVEIVFINQLARAQQIQDVTSMQQLIQEVNLLAQLIPEAVDNLDPDGIVRHMARILGVPEVAIRNSDEVQAQREARQAEIEAQQRQEQAVAAADIISKTNPGGGE